MAITLEFPTLLRLLDERSTAFRAAVASAPSLDVEVPTCPGWTLFDLVQHLGGGDRFWAAVVSAGPADTPPVTAVTARATVSAPRDREALLTWLTESTNLLLTALRQAGPDNGCWTWWPASHSPRTSGAVARHRVQETAVHTYDAQLTLDAPQPLPDTLALDGVDEFLSTCCATPSPWPHTPTTFDFHTLDGHSWRMTVDETGAHPVPLTAIPPTTPGVSLQATPSDLVLFLYDRPPTSPVQITGDPSLIDLLRAWEPEE
ncbi:maleylpyruvate isomerase family mycothiol-dependent enzyme [Streptomyces sp. NPDC006997]|uniref:maleylpyruvate isomerase family mycothiol-dependent enzyme n=1 Tax=Streptomyces sp. NPDC006997 TaxID=3155356 RepID=UPI003404FE6B